MYIAITYADEETARNETLMKKKFETLLMKKRKKSELTSGCSGCAPSKDAPQASLPDHHQHDDDCDEDCDDDDCDDHKHDANCDDD